MSKKVKVSKDGAVTITMNGRDNEKFWSAVDVECAKWQNEGYVLTYIEKGGNFFKDGILTSLENMLRMLFGMREKHDPVVKMTFRK